MTAPTPEPMPNGRHLAGRRLAILGALLGVFASAYLLVDYVFGSGICLTGSGCDLVRASDFAYPLGIPMPLLGLVFYLLAMVMLLAAPPRRVIGLRADAMAAGWSVIGVGVMAFLTIVELFVIGALCSWCLLSAVASVLLASGAIAAWRSGEPVPEVVARSAHARRRLMAEVDRSRHDLRRFAGTIGGVLGVAFVALIALPAFTAGAPVDEAAQVASSERPRLGDGPVEVVVFSDFQCPACATAAPILSQLANDGSVSLVYRYFPLVQIHPNATAAAEAAEAAARQGSFWAFHDALFARQAAWADLSVSGAAAAFEALAAELGLDVDRWRTDAVSSAAADVVAADRNAAEGMRLSGTPTIFIDGIRYSGPLNDADLRRAVEATPGAP